MGKRDDRPSEETHVSLHIHVLTLGQMQAVPGEERHLSPQLQVATLVLRYKGFQLAPDLYTGTEQEGPCEESQQSPQLWVPILG